MIHDLKTWPHEWDAVADGTKTFEVRSNDDRDFAVGDMLALRKWDPSDCGLTHRYGAYLNRYGHPTGSATEAQTQMARVTYILHGGRFGLPPGVCVMSIERCPTPDSTPEASDGE